MAAQQKGRILGPGSYLRGGKQHYLLAVVDLDLPGSAPRLVPTSFFGHGLAIEPHRPERVALFEKKGPGACCIDLRAGRVLRPIRTAANRHFYGHGAYSADGKLLYATEAVLDDGYRGVLVVRDAETLEELGELPTFGRSPHDCRLLEDGRTMVIANGGAPVGGDELGCVTYVDVASETLLERVEIRDARFNAGHLALGSRGDLAVVSAPRDGLPNPTTQLGAVTLVPKGGEARTVSEPEEVARRMLGETLSVAVHEPDEGGAIAGATHPEGNMVTFWRVEDASLLARIDALAGPRGLTLTLDGSAFVVSHLIGPSVALTLIPTDTLAPVESGRVNPSFTSGSHVVAHRWE